ncbi:MAG: GntR family transcriptional regulator [Victivallales bacterium]|jgi:DNA-binding LacI/PurR family transcriptional regulator
MKITVLQKKRELFDDIRNKIQSGELKTGEKLMSTKELAGKYGIAIQTAQRLLSKLVSDGLIFRTPGKGTFIANKKTIQKGDVVGLVMTCRGDIWGDFTARVSRELQNAGINIMYVEADSATENLLSMRKHPAILQILASNPIAIITRDSDLAAWLSNEFPEIRLICLTGDRIHDFSGDIVCPDMYQAGYMGTRHLIEHGRKRIFFYKIKGPDVLKISKHRELQLLCDGYCQAMKEAGLQEDIMVDVANGLKDKKVYSEKLKAPKPIDAIFVNFDFKATEFIQMAKEAGVSVPEDLAVVSVFNTPWANSFQLTSLDLHYDSIAEKCVEIILNSGSRNKGCSRVYKFKPELIIRKSCGC